MVAIALTDAARALTLYGRHAASIDGVGVFSPHAYMPTAALEIPSRPETKIEHVHMHVRFGAPLRSDNIGRAVLVVFCSFSYWFESFWPRSAILRNEILVGREAE